MSASDFYRKYPLHYARAEKGRGPRPRQGLWKGRGIDIRPARFPLTGEAGGLAVKRVAHRAALGDVARARCSPSRTGTTRSQCWRWWGQDAEADRLWWRVPSRNPVAGTVE
jgi:hypothetical protein